MLIAFQMDLRLKPEQKPKPENFPTTDPLAFALPLFDAYAGPVRAETLEDLRLNPILKDIDDIPKNVLLICAGIDILLHEQLTFMERIREDAKSRNVDQDRKFESMVFDKGFHGWLERELVYAPHQVRELTNSFIVPSYIVGKEDKKKAFDAAVKLILDSREG